MSLCKLEEFLRPIEVFPAQLSLAIRAVSRFLPSKRPLCTFVFVLMSSSVSALAQSPATPQTQAQSLSLQEALDRATGQNLDLVAARLRQAVSQAGIQIARQRPNPTVSFGAARDLPHESLLVDQPLELGGVRGRRIELARTEVSLVGIEYATLERQVRRKVRDAYFGAVLARGVTAFQVRMLEIAKRLQDVANARFEAGDVPQLETVQADLIVARAETDLMVSRQQEKTFLGQLNILLNEPVSRDWELVTSMDAMLSSSSMEELILRAQQSNPDLQHLMQEQKVEEARRSLLRAQRTPKVTLQAGSDFNAPPDFQVGPRGQVAVELPLFSRNQGELAQSQATSRFLESQVQANRRAVAGRLQAAYLDLVARKQQVELYHDKLLPAGRKLADMAEESYRAGKSGILNVLDAQRSAQQLEREYLDSLFAMQSKFSELEETIGAPLN
jgi:cobalt-zinc-cadmium efflux system outer membrane protein